MMYSSVLVQCLLSYLPTGVCGTPQRNRDEAQLQGQKAKRNKQKQAERGIRSFP